MYMCNKWNKKLWVCLILFLFYYFVKYFIKINLRMIFKNKIIKKICLIIIFIFNFSFSIFLMGVQEKKKEER